MKNLILLLMIAPLICVGQKGSKIVSDMHAWKTLQFEQTDSEFDKVFPTKKELLGKYEYTAKGIYNQAGKLVALRFFSEPVKEKKYSEIIPNSFNNSFSVLTKQYGQPVNLQEGYTITQLPRMGSNSIMECYEWRISAMKKIVLGVMTDSDEEYMVVCEIQHTNRLAAHYKYQDSLLGQPIH